MVVVFFAEESHIDRCSYIDLARGDVGTSLRFQFRTVALSWCVESFLAYRTGWSFWRHDLCVAVRMSMGVDT